MRRLLPKITVQTVQTVQKKEKSFKSNKLKVTRLVDKQVTNGAGNRSQTVQTQKSRPI